MSIISKTVAVTFDGGRTEDMTVNEIKLKDYGTALKCVGDEFGLVALACGRPRTVITELEPASYELVQAAVWMQNEKGFFAYAQRQGRLGAEMLSRMSPETLEALGAVILKKL